MDELKRRLEFPDRSIKIQAIKKLCDTIVAKYKSTLPINGSTPESAELTLLWEKCADTDAVVCQSVCDHVVDLVLQKQAEFGFVLSKLITLTSIARNFSGVVNAVGNLLMILVKSQSENDSDTVSPFTISSSSGPPHPLITACPFTISSSSGLPHPLITILVDQPESWTSVIQLIEQLLRHTNNSDLLVMLEPFVKFVLLEPSQPSVRLPLRLSLWSLFLQYLWKNGRVNYFLNLIPIMQINTSVCSTQTVQLLSSLGRQMYVYKVYSGDKRLRALVSYALGLASSLTQSGNDVSELIQVVLDIVENIPFELTPNYSYIVLHCILLIANSTPQAVRFCLKIVYKILSSHCNLNYLVIAMLTLPVFQLLVSSETLGSEKTTKMASAILNLVERKTEEHQRSSGDNQLTRRYLAKAQPLLTHPTEDGYTCEAVLLLVDGFFRRSSAMESWLKNLVSHAGKEETPPPYLISSLLAAILVTSQSSDIALLSLNALVRFVARDTRLSVQLLPLLLYKSKKTTDPKLRLAILEAIPRCATHAVSIGPTIAILHTLSAHPKLCAVSLRLASLLWQQQDRCFKYLLQMLENSLSSGNGRSGGGEVDEILVARAGCISDICQHGASKYGAEMTAHLSAILNDCPLPEQAPAVCLALQALGFLCESEAIDIRTAWNILAAKLKVDQRPLVLVNVTKLLALAPDLLVDTRVYQSFLSDALNFLWSLTRHSDARVAGSAFRALSRFPPTLHVLDQFPEEVKQVQLQELAKVAMETDDKDAEEDASASIIYGLCYTSLMQLLAPEVLPDFESFLSALVSHEAANFPRGLTFSANQQQTQNRAVTSIPSFVLDQFESNQKLGVRSSLAFGLLFCYDPTSAGGRDGRRQLQSLVTRGKNYHQMLYTLINDVAVEPQHWYQCAARVPAWTVFMNRCFLAYTEHRAAELQLELEKGQAKDPSENQLCQNGAWMWARDKLTDLIKSSSRGSPVVQSNCVSAMAGLALAVSNYVSRLDPEIAKSNEALTEHLRQPHWFMMVVETLLTIIDVEYQSRGRIFSICTQKTSNQDRAVQSTILARSSACVSISSLVPLLISANVEMVHVLLKLLLDGLPGKASDTVSDVLQMHCGIGVGLVVNKLLGEHFVDIAGAQGTKALWDGIRALEESAFSLSSARCGSLVGLAVCVDALCMDVRLDSRTYLCQLHDRISDTLDGLSSSDRSCEPLPLCLAILSGSAFIANVTTLEVINKDCEKLIRLYDLDASNVELCRAIGTLFYMLQLANHPTIKDSIRKISSTWKNVLDNENAQESEKVAALTGLTSLVGCHMILTTIPNEGGSVISEIGLEKDVIRTLKSLSSTGQNQLLSTGSWLTGMLYLARSEIGSRQSTLPSNYHFLPQTSVLRPLINLLTEFSKEGPGLGKDSVVSTMLNALTREGTRPFPALNWAALLGPILRLPFGPKVEELCILLAIQQTAFLPNLSSFLSSCLVSPFYNGLKNPAKVCLHRNLPALMRVVPVAVIRDFLDNSFVEPLRSHASKGTTRATSGSQDDSSYGENQTLVVATLQGLKAALKEKDPPANVSPLLWSALETVCSLCPLDDMHLWRLCCSCMRFAPESLMDDISSKQLTGQLTYLRGFFMRTFLVASGNQPLVWLNSAIESITYNQEIRHHSSIYWLLLQVFRACNNSSSAEWCQPLNRMQWLLELMGHIKTLLRLKPPADDSEEMSPFKIIHFLVMVFLCAVISWSKTSSGVILAVPEYLSFGKQEEIQDLPGVEEQEDILFHENDTLFESILMNLAPGALLKLLQEEPWKQLTGRVLEWFLTVYEAPVVAESEGLKKVIRDCLLQLRHENDFRKTPVWGRIVLLK